MSLNVSLKKRLSCFEIDISFSCDPGTISVLIGPSGGGKTRLVRMLAGLDRPDKGRITAGDEVWFDSENRKFSPPRKRKTGYVFQDYTLFPHLNLFENVAFAASERKTVFELFEIFRIEHLMHRKPHMVSGGERQRCAICQALAREPEVLLLDEPFSALDFVTRRNLREEMINIKKRFHIPIIYVTHDINEAFFLADEILPLVDGRLSKTWLDRPLAQNEGDEQFNRAAREVKLALAY